MDGSRRKLPLGRVVGQVALSYEVYLAEVKALVDYEVYTVIELRQSVPSLSCD